MLKKIAKCLFPIGALLLLAGCVTSPGGVAPSTMPITANDSYTILKKDAIGEDVSYSILFIPITPPCSAYQALQYAKKENKADALVNVTGQNKSVYFLFINWQVMRVCGDAIKFQRGGAIVD